MNKNKTGRMLLLGVAGFTTVGGFLFDWNKTHLFNPRWTPHAKFHDGMTITLGALLGGTSLYLLEKKTADEQNQLLWGALLPSFFWLAMGSGFAYPGAKGLEAEFPDKVKKVGPLVLNEGPLSLALLAAVGLGYYLGKK